MSKPDLIIKLNSELRNSTHAITTHIGGQVGLAQLVCSSMLMNSHNRRWSAGISSCQLRCFTRYCGDAALRKYSCPGKLGRCCSLAHLKVSWGDKFDALAFLRVMGDGCEASPASPMYFDLGKHIDMPGVIPLLLATDLHQGRSRRGTLICLICCETLTIPMLLVRRFRVSRSTRTPGSCAAEHIRYVQRRGWLWLRVGIAD
jgi:hypothetical protein